MASYFPNSSSKENSSSKTLSNYSIVEEEFKKNWNFPFFEKLYCTQTKEFFISTVLLKNNGNIKFFFFKKNLF
jgi:hypothetical protein